MNLRMQKINSDIHKKVSTITSKYSEIVSFPVINFVDTTKNLSTSHIYINFLSENPQQEFKKLSKYFGHIQEDFARIANYKKTPHLEFILDTKQKNIEKVEKILDNLEQ